MIYSAVADHMRLRASSRKHNDAIADACKDSLADRVTSVLLNVKGTAEGFEVYGDLSRDLLEGLVRGILLAYDGIIATGTDDLADLFPSVLRF